MIDLVVAFRTVVEALDDGGVQHVVVGSTAAAAWGVARTTRDIDLVATMSATDVARFLAAIEHTDLYVPEDDARRAAGGGSFNVLHRVQAARSMCSSHHPRTPSHGHAWNGA